MPSATVAALQLTSTEDVTANLAQCAALARAAAAAGASLIGLPENFAYLGTDRDHRSSIAEALPVDLTGDGSLPLALGPPRPAPSPLASLGLAGPPRSAGQSPASLAPPEDLKPSEPGPILGAMQALARETGAWLLLGGFPERASTPSHIRNTSVLLRADGSVAATYRKIHLFDVDVPGGKRFRESESIEPGETPVVAETPWGPLGLTICYDLRFPELYRALVARGARVLAVPSAFTLETGKDHWSVLLRARAIENQAYVLAPAQFGHHGGDRRSWGHAMVVDPWGTVLAECGDHAGFALASLDFDYQDRVRASLPCLTHRKVRGD